MNIEDLQNININDLKNIDWRSAKERLFSQPNKILNVVIICATLITIHSVYRSWAKTSKTLKVKLTQQEEKTQALEKFKNTQKIFREFLNNVPEVVSENRLIEMLSKIALESGVQIISLSPTTKKSDLYSNLTNIKITISSKNYSDIIRFMYKLEHSENSIRVKGWKGSLRSAGNRNSRRSGWGGVSLRQDSSGISSKQNVEATIEIETVEFKNA